MTHEVIDVDSSALDRSVRDSYRMLSGRAAKGVAVVSTVVGRYDHATTVTDYLSVSYDPPTMLVSLYGLSRTAEAVDEAGRWALSLLASDQRTIADELGELGAPLRGLLARTPHWRRELGAPAIIDGCVAWFECRTTAVHDAATHTLVVGEVVAMGRSDDHDATPLVHYRSEYGTTQRR
ncbi:flavin reductase family protein [Paramicrobacterium agarici]|uniref:Flavin reductase (DIM6/NTAB) family NADH-FMN oxidoreductase RutF n=1 Tax=Paramicrobacterium agarici TaxID=630514 RepID=A0A2A9DST9_9MICO|nr:flavin reductase family protein [Microbacterium agarici]PFG29654.1 flavin reductase (DIM6/NTAB) family NADH-FMN oxidoreductase RutF [Microbacterium agarici]TQO22677.1 flavin reductase (DIM6/NTAB) family NADH-FMN oxidoreductase RutF [Microbacterium agarici]